jgi:hypothetical protein
MGDLQRLKLSCQGGTRLTQVGGGEPPPRTITHCSRYTVRDVYTCHRAPLGLRGIQHDGLKAIAASLSRLAMTVYFSVIASVSAAIPFSWHGVQGLLYPTPW